MRLLKRFKILSITLISGCASGPIVDVCISFPVKHGFVCVDKQQKPYFKDYNDSLKYLAFSPEDAQVLVEACGITGKKKSDLVKYVEKLEGIAENFQPEQGMADEEK